MDRRLELDAVFRDIINITDPIDGDRHVYFQPPESRRMKFPALRYSLKGYRKIAANNGAYRTVRLYELVLIDSNPDSIYFEPILLLPFCSFDRHYVADNLNHFVFTLYY